MILLTKRRFDTIWYINATLGISAIFLFESADFYAHLYSRVALCISGAAAIYISLFVRRVPYAFLNLAHQVEINDETCLKPAATVASDLKHATEKSASVNVAKSGRTVVLQSMTEELIFSYSEEWLALHKDSANRVAIFYLEQVAHQQAQITLRRNILREATEMARHLQGTDVGVIVTPDSQILLRDFSTKHKKELDEYVEPKLAHSESKTYIH